MAEWKIIRNLVYITKKYSLPGFSGVPVYDVIVFVVNEAKRDDIVTRSNAVAFTFFLSLFPAIIFLFTLLPMLPFTADYLSLFRETTAEFFPQDAHNYLFRVIEGVVSIKRGSLQTLGLIFAIFFSSSGMTTLMYGFNKTHERVFKKRSYAKYRLVAILLTMLLGALFMVSMLLIIFGQPILEVSLDKLNVRNTGFVFTFLKWSIAISLIYLGITLIYRYGSAMKERIKWFNTGAILATILSIISSLLFSYFINNFGQYNEIYGSIGALIVLLIWLEINAFVILVGFEFNASIAVNKAIL
ncbi:MAG: YihY/virulence factor BrkB family protein [Bacteroidia bacterium]|nr:YihY/virulence factor BrkB family protein [Bacteroidia bacterium]